MIQAPNLRDLPGLEHGFGLRDSVLPPGITTVKQIHSAIVLDAAFAENAGELKEGDALVSDEAGRLIGVKTADCVPILLADPTIPVVAAIHAGWRGTAGNIVTAAIQELVSLWKTRPENIRTAIGPSIGVCCYEVSAEVARRFAAWVPELSSVEGHIHLDLPRINELQLRAAGVVDIWTSGECTFCAARRFYSFRREREQAGRMLSFIGLQNTSGGPQRIRPENRETFGRK
jgi:YfiH family protein